RDRGDVVEVQAEHADRAEVPEHEEPKEASEPVVEREDPRRERGDPACEADRAAGDPEEVRRAPDVDITAERHVPQIVEGGGEDGDERADSDERDPELGPERTDDKGLPADRTAGHRGRGREQGGEPPEGDARVDEKMRCRPERVAPEDPVPRDIPARTEPAEERPEHPDDERNPGA